MAVPCRMDTLAAKVAARFRSKIGRFEAMDPAGAVGVDSGSLVVIDPAYLKYWGTGEHPELSYDSVMGAGPVKQLHFNNGAAAGVLISNFGGDGAYPVFREPSGGSFAVDFSQLALKVAARYKGKKKTEEGNTVYLYSDRQIARRNAEKAKRLEGLRSNIDKLRGQVKKDLASGDRDAALTALAIALIDETYERVGNDESAGEGHFGVTGWTKKHVSFGKGGATIKYVGKAGVKHEKVVSDKAIVKALKDAYDGCKGDCIFEHEAGRVDAGKVNAYLKKFDISAKDLRGFHANREMQERLRAARKGKLSEDKKEREKQLKAEFKKALEATAEAVGHEPSTLKSQYLVPGLEEQYLKDGTVTEKMVKKAGAPSQAQIDYARRLIKQVGGEEPDWAKLDSVELSNLIDGLKQKRGKPVFYGNGQFSHWEKKATVAERVAARFAARRIDWAPAENAQVDLDVDVGYGPYAVTVQLSVPGEYDRVQRKERPAGSVYVDEWAPEDLNTDDRISSEIQQSVEKALGKRISWTEGAWFRSRSYGVSRGFVVR